MIADVEDLSLSLGTKNSLARTLEAAAAVLDRGNINAGTNKLKAFLNKVDA